jgi:hypothetical protein
MISQPASHLPTHPPTQRGLRSVPDREDAMAATNATSGECGCSRFPFPATVRVERAWSAGTDSASMGSPPAMQGDPSTRTISAKHTHTRSPDIRTPSVAANNHRANGHVVQYLSDRLAYQRVRVSECMRASRTAERTLQCKETLDRRPPRPAVQYCRIAHHRSPAFEGLWWTIMYCDASCHGNGL